MPSPNNYLIYQAYGNQAILTEVLFSAASVLAQTTDPPQLVIYTDQPDWFRQYRWLGGTQYILLNPTMLADWAGPDKFVHRVKICILADAATRFDGKLIYLDSDTLVMTDINRLFGVVGPKVRLTHTNEGSLRDSPLRLNRKIGQYMHGKTWAIDGQAQSIGLDTQMYNAGVLGMTTADAQVLLPKVLHLTDQLYHTWPKHTMEQLAFSYVLGQHQVIDTTASVLHYWKLKALRPQLIDLAIQQLAAQLDHSAQDLIQALNARYDFPTLLANQNAWDAKPSIWRKVLTLLGRGWDLRNL